MLHTLHFLKPDFLFEDSYCMFQAYKKITLILCLGMILERYWSRYSIFVLFSVFC